MKIFHTALAVAILTLSSLAKPIEAFMSSSSPTVVIQSASPRIVTFLHSSNTAESEAERLLRRARELREQAAQAEQQVHSELNEKKCQQEQHLDGLIDTILNKNNKNTAVKMLQEKHVSMETLEHMVDRLDDRLAMAEGGEHITSELEIVKHPHDEQLERKLQAQIETLLAAVQVLDDDFRRNHSNKSVGGVAGNDSDGTGSLLYSVSSVEASHWGGGHAHAMLEQRLHEKQRSRTEQFQKRQAEFYEAQKIKKKHVEKVKDDHGFLP